MREGLGLRRTAAKNWQEKSYRLGESFQLSKQGREGGRKEGRTYLTSWSLFLFLGSGYGSQFRWVVPPLLVSLSLISYFYVHISFPPSFKLCVPLVQEMRLSLGRWMLDTYVCTYMVVASYVDRIQIKDSDIKLRASTYGSRAPRRQASYIRTYCTYKPEINPLKLRPDPPTPDSCTAYVLCGP